MDKWLWQARYFKTRSLAAGLVQKGHVRVNAQPIAKPAYLVSAGDVLTFAQGRSIRVVKVLALGHRRGPASEAQGLYEDLTPDPGPAKPRIGARPTKRDRRRMEAWRDDQTETDT